MTYNPDDALTLVLGGTGKTGRRIVHRLTARDLPVRVGTRGGGLPFDWEDQETWVPALDGVDAVYVSYYPDLATPGAVDVIRAFVDAAAAARVRRMVLASGRGEEEAQASEKLVRESGVDWTVLRLSWFSQNFSENYLLDPVLGGEVVLPAGETPEPFIDAEDIADVATAALTEDGHAGRTYELTGPRLLTFAAAVDEIAKATGRDISFVSVSAGDFATGLRQADVPADVIDLLTYLFTTVLDGRNANLSDDVERILGRPATDFAVYARRTAATGVWNAKEAS